MWYGFFMIGVLLECFVPHDSTLGGITIHGDRSHQAQHLQRIGRLATELNLRRFPIASVDGTIN